MLDLNKKKVFITGGTGSFGQKFIAFLLENYKDIQIIVYSRDEHKQHQLLNILSKDQQNKVKFFLGDIRDLERLKQCIKGSDYVIHAAALKHVPAGEENPSEFIKTNIIGAENLISAAIEAGVKKVIAMSTDKAVSPTSLYGATKLCADKLFAAAGNSVETNRTLFSVVRFGNLMGSRGSILPLFLSKAKEGIIPITDPEMTRFHISYLQIIQSIMFAMEKSLGGEIIVPKLASFKIIDLATALAPECKTEIIGIRPGEKLHEELITEIDSFKTFEVDNYYITIPYKSAVQESDYLKNYNSLKFKKNFNYRSDKNNSWLTIDELRNLIGKETEPAIPVKV